MLLVTVQAKRRLESCKFGVAIPAGRVVSALTDDECIFYVKVFDSSRIFLRIEGKDLDILSRHGRVEEVIDQSNVLFVEEVC
jgi:hypothetical protein